MVSLEDRLKNVHPNARKKVRPDAKYVSDGLSEFYLDRNYAGYWSIKRYGGGSIPGSLKGSWISFIEAERRLIAYLEQTNKFGRAIYPNGKS